MGFELAMHGHTCSTGYRNCTEIYNWHSLSPQSQIIIDYVTYIIYASTQSVQCHVIGAQ